MNPKRICINIAKSLIVFTMAALAFAHGGFDHVMGTVVKVAGDVLTVKTAKGSVGVKLDEKTELTMAPDNMKCGRADLKPGTRVVVDIPENSKDKPALAHSVKIGIAMAGHDATHQ